MLKPSAPMGYIYLDFAATTPCDPSVIDAMEPYWNGRFGNPSSIHLPGRQARAAIDLSREEIASSIKAHPSEIYFVSGGTEANNLAIKGAAYDSSEGKNHIITSRTEHPSVLESCAYLEKRGFTVTYLGVNEKGHVDPAGVRDSIRENTGLISIMHVNNETGVINPIGEVSAAAREKGVLFHTDAVQAFGKIPVDVGKLDVDLLSLSAHKIYGPKGIGAIFIRRGVSVEKAMHGGPQERQRRAGTESVPLAVGFGKAAEIARMNLPRNYDKISTLRTECERMIREFVPAMLINNPRDISVPHILSLTFDSSKVKIDGEALLMNLDLAGIAASGGSACGSGAHKASHVLVAMGRDTESARSTVRLSFGVNTTLGEIKMFAGKLEEITKNIGSFRTG